MLWLVILRRNKNISGPPILQVRIRSMYMFSLKGQALESSWVTQNIPCPEKVVMSMLLQSLVELLLSLFQFIPAAFWEATETVHPTICSRELFLLNAKSERLRTTIWHNFFCTWHATRFKSWTWIVMFWNAQGSEKTVPFYDRGGFTCVAW